MSYRSIDVKPTTTAIGAEIHGIDLSQPLSSETVAEVRHAFLTHLVLFFRNQSITPSQQLTFARYFGEPSIYPFVKGVEDQPEIIEVKKEKNEIVNFGGLWHTDMSYLEGPPSATIVYARELPPIGGDTLFANMYLAYDALSDAFKEILQGLIGINSAEKKDAAITRIDRMEEKPNDANDIVTIAEHPIVRTHPETSRKALYCSDAHTVGIKGMTLEESNRILQYLYKVQQRPEFGCRFRWEKGSLAFWDNRASQHNALNDYHGYRRVMHRVTIAGDRPF